MFVASKRPTGSFRQPSGFIVALLVPIGLDTSRLGVGRRQSLRFSLVEHGLEDLLFLLAQDLRKVFVELGLFLLETYFIVSGHTLQMVEHGRTHKNVLEHAIRLNLVQRGLQQALLIKVILVFIGKRAELLGLYNVSMVINRMPIRYNSPPC